MPHAMKRRCVSARPGLRQRLTRPTLERMEQRLCLSTSTTGGGVDALALGDVNVDRTADIAVASHQGGHYLVTIYSGGGQPGSTQTGYESLPLVTITDPLGPGVGPLSIALGDFTGGGASDLAVSSTASGKGASPLIAIYTFKLTQSDPYNSPVTAVPLGNPFVGPSLGGSMGYSLAAADFNGKGPDDLVVAPSGPKANAVDIMDYQPTTSSWQVMQSITDIPVNEKQGLSVSAGDVTGDGTPDLVVGSKSSGQVAVRDTALGRWVWKISPLGTNARNIRVAVVSNENAPGSIVVTNQTSKGAQAAAIVPFDGSGRVRFLPDQSPGTGTLVPLGGGYVYQRSTIQNPTSSFPTSNGPVAPTVLFGSTGGSQLVVQGFTATNTPSSEDTYVEPLAGAPGLGFWPLQPSTDAATGGTTTAAAPDTNLPADSTVSSDLIAYPKIDYTSPYSIDLSGAPSSIYDGLLPFTSVEANSTVGPWGPDKIVNTPPTIPTGEGTTWLRERLIAAYASFIGVDYQHHHDASWTPAQGSVWNLTSTVGYQSQGVDCSSFTAMAYADALGIDMSGDTTQQALISSTNLNGTTIPSSLNNPSLINIQTIDHTQWSSYQQFLSLVQPGDILIINGNPTNTSQATHAVTWLGSYGTDANNIDHNLIIDATGTTPQHVNSNNQVVPEGVQIRPFGAPGTVNDWYFTHVDHILRIIAD